MEDLHREDGTEEGFRLPVADDIQGEESSLREEMTSVAPEGCG